MSFFPVNYFLLLGVEETYQQDNEKIRERYVELQKQLHPDRFVGATAQAKQLSVHYAAEVNHAYQTLLDPILRAVYLFQQKGGKWEEDSHAPVPETFLEEQLAWQEQIEQGDKTCQDEIKKKNQTLIEVLAQCFEKGLHTEEDYEKVKDCIYKMQFYKKLSEK